MEPTNDHERLIVQAVDEKFLEDPGSRHQSIVGDTAVSLDFIMSSSDSQFLVRYVEWRRQDGQLLDPWLRVHENAGATLVRVAPESMRISGSVAQWEDWTKLVFPESGTYVVAGALVPVEIDRERDEGVYVEPNVWMHHRV